ncbi:class I SAM-dependent rRNA methyltransferase [Calycomorphotria hydatis]|uniref:Ribosomal RNA large subunit methyltransferase I n=1 Tax=Calycomorphotria hydatis TaxID=2528027 RepID=A0A517T982_9PLAN|nr:class I SAM-dependent rRNA methyltransferase [Calycomorphotria hydatis]QDT64923.1 Ribosomal RNA large subunit methyltransferase I [Calycomorphotria hydatis]
MAPPKHIRKKQPPKLPLASEHLAQRSLGVPADMLPKIVVKSPSRNPLLFRKRLGEWDSAAHHGDMVEAVLEDGTTFGYGLFNPRAEIALRMLNRDPSPPSRAWWGDKVKDAIHLRKEVLRLDEVSDTYRLIHAESDGLTGLVVDRFGDVLSAEVFSLGIYQRIEEIMSLIKAETGLNHCVYRPGPRTTEQEGFTEDATFLDSCPQSTTVTEHGIRYNVDFNSGHKTGFFCDQRDNRQFVASHTAGKQVLDLCCYTGGFSLAAHCNGKAAEVTGVDLDEAAIKVARSNANLNRAKGIRFVHADAFPYMRDMLANGKKYDVVVLDPPKLIHSRDDFEEGRRTYFDLNRLAYQLVQPGGYLFSCSCSGLMPADEFQKVVCTAAPDGLHVRLLEKRGAAPDHPVSASCPETSYLKSLWLHVS